MLRTSGAKRVTMTDEGARDPTTMSPWVRDLLCRLLPLRSAPLAHPSTEALLHWRRSIPSTKLLPISHECGQAAVQISLIGVCIIAVVAFVNDKMFVRVNAGVLGVQKSRVSRLWESCHSINLTFSCETYATLGLSSDKPRFSAKKESGI